MHASASSCTSSSQSSPCSNVPEGQAVQKVLDIHRSKNDILEDAEVVYQNPYSNWWLFLALSSRRVWWLLRG